MTSAWITSTGSGAGEAPGAFIDAVSSVIDSIISAIDEPAHLADLPRVHVPVVVRLRGLLQDGVGFGEAVHADGRLHGARWRQGRRISVERSRRRLDRGSASCTMPKPVGRRMTPLVAPGVSAASASRSSGAELREHHGSDEAAARRRRIDRLRRARARRRRRRAAGARPLRARPSRVLTTIRRNVTSRSATACAGPREQPSAATPAARSRWQRRGRLSRDSYPAYHKSRP